jgi:hypothetical protein
MTTLLRDVAAALRTLMVRLRGAMTAREDRRGDEPRNKSDARARFWAEMREGQDEAEARAKARP